MSEISNGVDTKRLRSTSARSPGRQSVLMISVIAIFVTVGGLFNLFKRQYRIRERAIADHHSRKIASGTAAPNQSDFRFATAPGGRKRQTEQLRLD